MPGGSRTEAERSTNAQNIIWRKTIDDEMKSYLGWYHNYSYMLQPKYRPFEGPSELEVDDCARPQSSPSVAGMSQDPQYGKNSSAKEPSRPATVAGTTQDPQYCRSSCSKEPSRPATALSNQGVTSRSTGSLFGLEGEGDLVLPDWTLIAKKGRKASRRKPILSSPSITVKTKSPEEELLALAKTSPPRIRARIQAQLPPKMKLLRPLISSHDVGWLPPRNLENPKLGMINTYGIKRHKELMSEKGM